MPAPRHLLAPAATSLALAACTHTAPEPTPALIGMANPASVFCVQQGGTVRITNTPQGQRGDCVLPDGRVIEEWQFFREHHARPKIGRAHV